MLKNAKGQSHCRITNVDDHVVQIKRSNKMFDLMAGREMSAELGFILWGPRWSLSKFSVIYPTAVNLCS